MNLVSRFSALAFVLAAGLAHAQTLDGKWQARMTVNDQDHRLVQLRIGKTSDAAPTATLSFLDGDESDSGARTRIDEVSIKNGELDLKGPQTNRFKGRVNVRNGTISGTWTAGGKSQPVTFARVTQETEWKDPTPHKVRLIPVDKDVKLEVLDFGGSGRDLVLLTGLGNSAHVYDQLALKLTPRYHVYAISRRGYGASTTPPIPAYMITHLDENKYELRPIDAASSPYASDRLGDDVIAVLDALKIAKPVIAGHSIAGEELTSIGTRHPDRMAGAIYLDAMYGYAYYDGVNPLNLTTARFPLKLTLPSGERLPLSDPAIAVLMGEREYKDLPRNVLALNAFPMQLPDTVPEEVRNQMREQEKGTMARYERIEHAFPKARFVQLAGASHYVWRTNEVDTLREMDAFIKGLEN